MQEKTTIFSKIGVETKSERLLFLQLTKFHPTERIWPARSQQKKRPKGLHFIILLLISPVKLSQTSLSFQISNPSPKKSLQT